MAALLTAADFQPANDRAVTLADKREARVETGILGALTALATALNGQAVLDLISRADIYGLLKILQHPDVVAAMTTAFGPIADTRMEAATDTSEKEFGKLIPFDPLANAAPLMAQRQHFVDTMLGQSRQVMKDSILRALRYGIDPEGVQIALQQVIGLTPQQATAIANYRRLLEEGDAGALNRTLRDARFDSTVRRAIDSEVQLSQDQIDRMVERYAERQLAFRAETIARTEAMNAATGGIRDAYVQAVNSGKLTPDEVRRHWLVCIDERLCPICASVPILNPNGVGVLEPYMSAAGPLMTVGVHPRCRCSERYTANLTRLEQQPFAQAA